MARKLGADLVFMTDGQETPPLSWEAAPDFSGVLGSLRGVVIGVGGRRFSPIPKYDSLRPGNRRLQGGRCAQRNRRIVPRPRAPVRGGRAPPSCAGRRQWGWPTGIWTARTTCSPRIGQRRCRLCGRSGPTCPGWGLVSAFAFGAGCDVTEVGKKASSPFLEKRTKKFLLLRLHHG